MDASNKPDAFSSAEQDAKACKDRDCFHPSYRLAYTDQDFMHRDELRSVRLQLEWLKPDLTLDEHDIQSTVAIFGSARFPEPGVAAQSVVEAENALKQAANQEEAERNLKRACSVLKNARYYDEARKLAKKLTQHSLAHGGRDFVVTTGGGPGIMEAANRGAADAGGKSIGLNIVLPFEQRPNEYITPELCFQFHYFALRKMHFLNRARALIACPGGFGTLDELFETLTLIQTQKARAIPVVLLGKEYWSRLIDFDFLVEQGAISEKDLALFEVLDSAEEAWDYLSRFW